MLTPHVDPSVGFIRRKFKVGEIYLGEYPGGLSQMFVMRVVRVDEQGIGYEYLWQMMSQAWLAAEDSASIGIWNPLNLVRINQEKADCLVNLWSNQ